MRSRRRRPAGAGWATRVALGCLLVLPPVGLAPLHPSPAAASPVPAGGSAPGSDRGEEPQPSALSRAVARLVILGSDPLVRVAALRPTALEREEPERLYALVTRERPVRPADYAPDDLEPLPGGFYEARAEVAGQVAALLDAAREQGHVLEVTSGFRDYATQAGTFADWAGRLGEERADLLSARPGHSEHQLGLAVDLGGPCNYQCFGASPEGQWVAENAHRWGFIIRYPQDGQAVTGYAWEPWHLRYVGPRAAWGMHLADEAYWEHFQPVAARAAGLG